MRLSQALPERGELDPRARAAIRGGFIGFFLDMYDIYLPVVVLGPALIYFIPSDMPVATAGIISSLTFVATLLGRPFGALVFGRYADKIGRKRTNLIAVNGFAVMSIVLAVLPGFETWGLFAVGLFIFFRFVDGVFVGGSYSASSPLAMEYMPKEKRGYYGAYLMMGFPFAFVGVSVLTLIMLAIAPAGGIDSPYVQWGWRVPFLIGALITFIYAYWYWKNVDESKLFEASGGTEEPLKELFRGDSLRSFIQVFVLMSGFWLSLNTVTALLPGLLRSQVGLTSTQTTIVLSIAYTVLAVGYLVAGVVSQVTGRRPFLMLSGIGAAVVGTGVYAMLLTSPPAGLGGVIPLVTVLVFAVVWFWGLATTYINERFKTGVRATGFGLGYSLAVIPSSFYAFYQGWLDTFLPFELTVLPLLALGGLLIVFGAAIGPETRDVEFTPEPREPPAT